jgi:hypothetical protein
MFPMGNSSLGGRIVLTKPSQLPKATTTLLLASLCSAPPPWHPTSPANTVLPSGIYSPYLECLGQGWEAVWCTVWGMDS